MQKGVAAVSPGPNPATSHGFSLSHTIDPVVLLLVIVTAALAWYTSRLRRATLSLAEDTVVATRLSDRHHQESLAPVCVLSEVEYNLQPPTFGKVLIKLAFRVENQGSGPAVAVGVRIAPQSSSPTAPPSSLSHALLPLKAGAKSHLISPQLYDFAEADRGFNITVEFENMFGAKGRSEWHLSQDVSSSLRKLELPPAQDRL